MCASPFGFSQRRNTRQGGFPRTGFPRSTRLSIRPLPSRSCADVVATGSPQDESVRCADLRPVPSVRCLFTVEDGR
jgi:hypothetical protein